MNDKRRMRPPTHKTTDRAVAVARHEQATRRGGDRTSPERRGKQ